MILRAKAQQRNVCLLSPTLAAPVPWYHLFSTTSQRQIITFARIFTFRSKAVSKVIKGSNADFVEAAEEICQEDTVMLVCFRLLYAKKFDLSYLADNRLFLEPDPSEYARDYRSAMVMALPDLR